MKKGEKGEAIGTSTTRTKEVDKIVREAYDEVYKGIKKNIGEATEMYLKEYEKYIYEGPEATIAPPRWQTS